MDKLFYYDLHSNKSYSYTNLSTALNEAEFCSYIIYEKDNFELFKSIILSILIDKPIILLDQDFSLKEIEALGVELKELEIKYAIGSHKDLDTLTLVEEMLKSKDWSVTLFTSGTTGRPKKIVHTLKSLTREVKVDVNKSDNIWGFAYNPTHIAGLQVFLQAILNLNTIINLFRYQKTEIFNLIEKFNITNISATPTFYRLLLPEPKNYSSIRRITSGGEKFDSKIANDLLKVFHNAKILNIYASTEAGTVFSSKDDIFTVKDRYTDLVKIVEGELFLSENLLGSIDSSKIEDGWYKTGDIVEVLNADPLTIKFVNRANELINIGGNKVNPMEIEEVICQFPNINLCRVYGKSNSVLGNILVAEIECSGDVVEKELRIYLSERLQDFKVPRIIKFVQNIQLSHTGKIKRTA